MARTDLERYRGDTKDLTVKLTQNSEIFDLTGFSATLSVSAEENPTDDSPVFQSTAAINIDDGALTFPFLATDVNQVGDFYYDIELTDGAGKTNTIRKGRLIFRQDITK